MIVSGSESQVLAARLADVTGRPLARVAYDRFPDGEIRINVPETDADEAVIVASTTTDDAHVELLQLQDALRGLDVSEITTVIPYLGYARQDRAFDSGDPISIRAVARAVSTGTDRVVTVNPHQQAGLGHFDVPTEVVNTAPRLADPIPEDLEEPLFLAPDQDAIDLAETVRDAFGRGDVDALEKVRYSSTDVDVQPRDAEVNGRDVILVDDIIATGSTMSEAIGVLDDRDAARVFVTCVHPVLAKNAMLRLSSAGVESIYGTDTVERPVSDVSAAPAIADVL
jgi:ribose-phosphate pyrophosphokinase